MVWKHLALGLLTFIIYKVWAIRKRFNSIPLPAPKGSPILGHFRLVDPLVSVIETQKEMKDLKTYKLRQIYIVSVFSSDANFIREVLSIKNLPKSDTYNEIGVWWGQGNLLTSQHDGTNWKQHRQLLNPIFRTAAIRKLRDSFEKHSFRLVTKIEELVGSPIDFGEIVQKTTLDIIADAGFGYDLGALDDKSSDFLTALKHQISLLANPLALFPYGGHLIKFLNRRSRKIVDDVVERVVLNRMNNKESKEVNDILDMMITADESYDPETLKSDLFTFFVAGHETSASSLAFLLYELAKNPEVQEHAYQEVESVLQGKRPNPDLDLITSLPFLMNCLNEGLRLYPIAGGVSRQVNEDTVIQGIQIPKGTMIECNFFLSHRDPDMWPEPDKFIPSRFNGKSPNPNEFFPFSAGPRICIGKNFFYEESLVILSHILHKFTFTLEEGSSGEPNQITGLLKPNKVILKFSKRV